MSPDSIDCPPPRGHHESTSKGCIGKECRDYSPVRTSKCSKPVTTSTILPNRSSAGGSTKVALDKTFCTGSPSSYRSPPSSCESTERVGWDSLPRAQLPNEYRSFLCSGFPLDRGRGDRQCRNTQADATVRILLVSPVVVTFDEEEARLDRGCDFQHSLARKGLDETARAFLAREADPELARLVAAEGQDAVDVVVVAETQERVSRRGRGDRSHPERRRRRFGFDGVPATELGQPRRERDAHEGRVQGGLANRR